MEQNSTPSGGGDWLVALRSQRDTSSTDWTTTLLLSLLLGPWGADRFYAGRYGLGLLKLATCGGFLLWWAFDLALVAQEKMRDASGRRICR